MRSKINLKEPGRLLSHSKTDYSKRFPNNLVVFNANLVTPKLGKIWYGDIDVHADLGELTAIAKDLGESVYVLREHDARFQYEHAPLVERRVAEIRPDGLVDIKKKA